MTNWQEELSVRHPEALESLNRRGYIQRKDIQPYENENPDGTTEMPEQIYFRRRI